MFYRILNTESGDRAYHHARFICVTNENYHNYYRVIAMYSSLDT